MDATEVNITEVLGWLEQLKLNITATKGDLKELESQKRQLEAHVLYHFEVNGVHAIDTEHTKFYTSSRSVYTLDDAEALYKEILKTQKVELLQRRVHSGAAKEYEAETGHLPPGVSHTKIPTLVMRKRSQK